MFGFGFGSGSSSPASSSSPSNPPPASTPTTAPNREQRALCWSTRDAYFGCLDGNGVLQPGTEAGGVCAEERKGYEGHCGRSWIDYFNKRHVLELRQKATMEAAARARDANPANAGR